jgi:L-aspartate oxidase
VASTGVHGANRLASNSLLEGVVYGARAGRDMIAAALPEPPRQFQLQPFQPVTGSIEELRRMANDFCGIVRSGPGLEEALRRLAECETRAGAAASRAVLEFRATRTVIELIARCAMARRESRGAHRRIDYPERLQEFQKHSMISHQHAEVRFE